MCVIEAGRSDKEPVIVLVVLARLRVVMDAGRSDKEPVIVLVVLARFRDAMEAGRSDKEPVIVLVVPKRYRVVMDAGRLAILADHAPAVDVSLVTLLALVTVTVCGPAVAYVWLAVAADATPLLVEPSPQLTL